MKPKHLFYKELSADENNIFTVENKTFKNLWNIQ